MPASPIVKKLELDEFPPNWKELNKIIIPDQATACYWGVWYGRDKHIDLNAWLMWCPIDDDPSVNDSWGHAEEINGDCEDVLDTIESVFGVSFHDSIYRPIIPSGPVAIGKGETWDGE